MPESRRYLPRPRPRARRTMCGSTFRRSKTDPGDNRSRATPSSWQNAPVSWRTERLRSSSARSPADSRREHGMRMHSRALLLISNLVGLNLSSAQRTPNPRPALLIGSWEAITRSTGGLGSTISFASDNTMSYTLGAMVDMKYRRTRDSLYIIDPQGVVSPFKVSVLRDTLL